MMQGCLEDLPLGVLGLMYIQKTATLKDAEPLSPVLMLSIASSFLLASLVVLHDFIDSVPSHVPLDDLPCAPADLDTEPSFR